MIEKMKVAYIIAPAAKKQEFFDELRELGVLHLSRKKQPDAVLTERFAALSKLSVELKDYSEESTVSEKSLTDKEFARIHENALYSVKRKALLNETLTDLTLEAEKLRAWGYFDPDEFAYLKEKGFDFKILRLGKKELKTLKAAQDIKFIELKSVDKMSTVAVLGDVTNAVQGMEFVIPQKGLSQLEREIDSCKEQIAKCDNALKLAAQYLNSYKEQLLKAQNETEYSAAVNSAEGDDDIIWISGYFPASDTDKFTECAKKNNWAWILDDADPADTEVPTKVRYNKVTALMKPIFDILGTVPAYTEYDISFWFLAFFTLFFAMIIGDAGYGVLFLIGAAALHIKSKKVTNITLLLYVLSAATVVWGSLTGTWFGLEGAMKVPFLKALVIPQFANYPEYFGVTTSSAQNSVMKFCFTIGVIQLALACIMNVKRKIGQKDLSWLSDVGWLTAISALYFMVLYLVIGQKVNFTAVITAVVTGFVLVVLFGGMSPDKTFAAGLKSGLADTFTTFLNTISAFGNVMSYIRLFAVGMASLAIAQSFNDMASGFGGPLVIVGAVIMIIGHALNIVMGFLSVVVHGVRLNLLEFSGQLGMEWSGTAYEPFKKLKQIKK